MDCTDTDTICIAPDVCQLPVYDSIPYACSSTGVRSCHRQQRLPLLSITRYNLLEAAVIVQRERGRARERETEKAEERERERERERASW